MIVLIPAIQLVIDVARATTADIAPLRIGVDTALAGRTAIVRRGVDRSGREEQRLCLTAVEREIDNTLLIDELRDIRGFCRQHLRIGVDINLLPYSADVQGYGLRRGLVDIERNAILTVGGEAFLFDLKTIGPHGESGEKNKSRLSLWCSR